MEVVAGAYVQCVRVLILFMPCWAVLAGECLEAVSGELSFFTLPNCFELFGFDLTVDEDWHVWLLEVRSDRDIGMVSPYYEGQPSEM